jgi:hypothetical protein
MRAWQGDSEMLNLIRSLKAALPGVHVRVSNPAAALGPAFDGSWSHEDVDLAVITVPALVAPTDADACLRVLLADYNHFAAERKPAGQPSLLIMDEFLALAGGRRMAIDLLERGRGAGAGVVLAGQSTAALGDDDERARLLAAASATIAFRSPAPAELAALAGSERVAEAAGQLDGEDLTGRTTVTMRSRGRVDLDQVRAARVGEAQIIAAGRVERARIIRPAIPAETHSRADALLSHGPSQPLEAPRGDSQAPDERQTSGPGRSAPADDQPGGLGPAAGAVRLAGLTALPSPGPCTRRLRGVRSPLGDTGPCPAASRVHASGAAYRRP